MRSAGWTARAVRRWRLTEGWQCAGTMQAHLKIGYAHQGERKPYRYRHQGSTLVQKIHLSRTTLLAMVDASVGGKTGINFGGLKNEVGVFNDSKFVILDTEFLKTLDAENICSGYAEMLKHGLISTEAMWEELVSFDLDKPDLKQLQRMVGDSVKVKERIVEQDPHEQGIRKALNLGHTFGHAFESWALKRKPILHGYAVAFGLIPELYLSVAKTGFPTEKMRQTVNFIKEFYGTLDITCDDYDELIELMHHDKKNQNGIINFTMLGGIGDIRINQTATTEEIKEALDFFREG